MKKEFDVNKTVILVSGGMDSCVTAAIASKEYKKLAFLHVNYGQKTEARELKAFKDIQNFYSSHESLIIDMKHFNKIGGSSLTDIDIPISDADLNNKHIPSSYVPFRNANILSAAVSWAEIIDAKSIYIGAVEEDSSGYPDCRRSFFDAFETTIKKGTKPDTSIDIITPLINLSKKEIILKGIELNAPLHLSWSCYQNETKPCKKCDSCALRARGFEQAKIKDPILK